MKKTFLTYCRNTSLHGFIYIGKEKSMFAKIFWFITCISCLIFASYLLSIQIERFNSDITRTELKSNIYPIWNAPFPAVTICNYNAIHAMKAKYYETILSRHNFNSKDIHNFFKMLKKFTSYESIETPTKEETYEQMLNILKNSGYDVVTLMRNLAHSCKDMIKRCTWISKNYDCDDLFTISKTTMGFCCSFNYQGYTELNQEKTEIYYVAGAGFNFGLNLEIDVEESQYISDDRKKGVEVLIHSNYAYPDMSLLSYFIKTETFTTLSLSLAPLISKPDVRNIKTNLRGCLMEDENFLKTTNVYNFETCFIECKMNYIKELCKCVPYYSPLSMNDTCAFKNFECLKNYEIKLANVALKTTDIIDENELFIQRLSNEALACHCLPNCDEVVINTLIEDNRKSNIENRSLLNIHFNSISMLETERNLNITWDVFLASFGGIFGLALGGSVFNILEVIYYIFQNLLEKIINYIEKKFLINKPKTKIKPTNKIFVIEKPIPFCN